MPVIKRRPHITELLNIAVDQTNQIVEAKSEILNRPASIWLHAGGDEDNVADDFLSDFVRGLSPNVIIFSRLCEKVYLSKATRVIRFVIILLAISVMIYEAPRLSLNDSSSFSSMFFLVLDQVVNSWFLFDCIMRLCGLPIRVRIEEAFARDIDIFTEFWHSAIPDMALVLTCFGMGITTTGLWVRLARLMFLTAAVFGLLPHLQVLVSGIGNGLKSILFTILLLYVTIIIFAVMGHSLFADNDPYHFGNVSLSIWTFFQVSLFDSWATIFYLNFGGCDTYPSMYVMYNSTDPVGSLENLQFWFPNADDPFASIHTASGDFYLPICSNPRGRPVASVFLFFTFILVCGYFVMSLNLASVAIGINEKLEELMGMELYGADAEKDKYKDEVQSKDKRGSVTGPMNAKAMKMFGGKKEEAEMKKMLTTIWKEKVDVIVSKVRPSNFQKLCASIRNPKYRLFIICIMLMAAAMEFCGLDEETNELIPQVHIMLQMVLSFDAIINAIVYYHSKPKELNVLGKEQVVAISRNWLIFNGLVTMVLWVPTGAVQVESLRPLRALREFRLLFFLKYLSNWLSELEIILTAIASSFLGLMYVLVLLVIFFFYFAIAGTLLFKESDPYNFRNVYDSMKSLLQIMTLDNVSHVMRTNMMGCHHYGYNTGVEKFDNLCQGGGGVGWVSAVYFSMFIILGAMVLVSLLVGVVITSMELLREGAKEEKSVWSDVKAVQAAFDVPDDVVQLILELFEKVDKNGNSQVTFTELQPLMGAVDILEADQFEFYMHVDRDSSGQIDFSEFCELICIIGFSLKKTAAAAASNGEGNVPQVERPSEVDAVAKRSENAAKALTKMSSSVTPSGSEESPAFKVPTTVKQREKNLAKELSIAHFNTFLNKNPSDEESNPSTTRSRGNYGNSLSSMRRNRHKRHVHSGMNSTDGEEDFSARSERRRVSGRARIVAAEAAVSARTPANELILTDVSSGRRIQGGNRTINDEIILIESSCDGKEQYSASQSRQRERRQSEGIVPENAGAIDLERIREDGLWQESQGIDNMKKIIHVAQLLGVPGSGSSVGSSGSDSRKHSAGSSGCGTPRKVVDPARTSSKIVINTNFVMDENALDAPAALIPIKSTDLVDCPVHIAAVDRPGKEEESNGGGGGANAAAPEVEYPNPQKGLELQNLSRSFSESKDITTNMPS